MKKLKEKTLFNILIGSGAKIFLKTVTKIGLNFTKKAPTTNNNNNF